VTTGGVFTEFAIPTASAAPDGITVGSDGALWFTESGVNQLGRVTTSGTFTEFPLPTANNFPGAIVMGPDGALWFTQSGTRPPRCKTPPP
jgi:virginiamycin B lyase